jgi:hypothetical protein
MMNDTAEFVTNCTVIDRRFNNRRVRGKLEYWMPSFGFAVCFRTEDIDYRYTSTSQMPPKGFTTWAGISSKDIQLDDSVSEVGYVEQTAKHELITRFRPVSDFQWYQETAQDE